MIGSKLYAVSVFVLLLSGVAIMPCKSLHNRDDNTPPTTTIQLEGVLGDNGWYVTDVWIALTAIDNESGVNATYYQIDTPPWLVYTWAFNLTTDGRHTISYYSIDNAGNAEPTHQQLINRDTISPVTTLSYDNGLVTFSAVDLTSGVNYTMVQIDGGGWMRFTAPIQIPGGGSHVVSYYSVDRAGNQEEINTTTIGNQPSLEITLLGGVGVTVDLQNAGETNLTGVNWSITPDIFLGNASGTVDIPANGLLKIHQIPLYLGKVTFEVTADDLVQDASCTVLFIFVFGLEPSLLRQSSRGLHLHQERP